ncbi:GFA family protein [Methylomicrobium agile]|uniref:GFA family protein n=1 Tax=Methylomicrobium agile TaxID=39774 RepID=UPI000A06D5F0|nr:GFA family protein [Methylomicrobium agile]
MNRKAKCSCGEIHIELAGDPKMVVACSCLNCQKRTGSVFGVGAYFGNDQIVSKVGDPKLFVDTSNEGRKLNRLFCSNCGTTVHWEAEFMPNAVGVAVGCFEDPNFPEPVAAAWNRSKHKWVNFPENWPKSDTQGFKKNA